MELSKKQQINKKAEDIKMYLAVISYLTGRTITFNGVPVSNEVILQAVWIELFNIMTLMGIKQEDFFNYCTGLEWKSNSPEDLEFQRAMQEAVSELTQQAGDKQ